MTLPPSSNAVIKKTEFPLTGTSGTWCVIYISSLVLQVERYASHQHFVVRPKTAAAAESGLRSVCNNRYVIRGKPVCIYIA